MPEITVAAARENAGRPVLRRSVSGEPRGVLCAMGICFECRVEIGGVAHRRACMEMETSSASPLDSEAEDLDCDVAVVGAGPAGIAAACRSAESGARTLVFDESPSAGGQIHRHAPGEPPPEAATAWMERLERSAAQLRCGVAIVDAERSSARGFRLAGEAGGRLLRVRAGAVVIASGARELFLPFPGWTLPGVMGAGGAQAMIKMGADFRGRTAVVAGSGPLLLPAAASLARSGVEVALVAEQARAASLLRFSAALLAEPGKFVDAAKYRAAFSRAPYRTGTWITEALGRERLEAVVLTDGRKSQRVDCGLAAVGYGLIPNTELARLLGCEIRSGAVDVGESQESSVPGVFCAGEPCGIAGLETARAEGEIAGLAAAGRFAPESEDGRRLAAARARGRRFAAALERAFRLRRELADAVLPATIVCRCEDVRRAALEGASGAREAKLATRAGMGPCQGRVCGAALGFVHGWPEGTIRPPLFPTPLAVLTQRSGEARDRT
jgi:thioredoxin reductase